MGLRCGSGSDAQLWPHPPTRIKVQFTGISAKHRRLSESSGLLSFGDLWTSRTHWLVVLFVVAPHSGGYSFGLFVRVGQRTWSRLAMNYIRRYSCGADWSTSASRDVRNRGHSRHIF